MPKGKRVDHYLTLNQVRWLQKKSRQSGLSVSEIIRRAIDLYIKTEGK
jgi:hypothetical protein